MLDQREKGCQNAQKRYSVDIFSYSASSGIMGFDKNRIPLNPVLGGVKNVPFPLVLINRLHKTESADV